MVHICRSFVTRNILNWVKKWFLKKSWFCKEIATRFVEFAKMHPTDKNELKIAIKWYYNLHKSKGKNHTYKQYKNVDWGGQPSSDGLTSSLEGLNGRLPYTTETMLSWWWRSCPKKSDLLMRMDWIQFCKYLVMNKSQNYMW